jgi:protein-S-isoprenylcysteine O-methyltransferase Ste14
MDKIKVSIINAGLSARYYRIIYNVVAVLLLLPVAIAYFRCPSVMIFKASWVLQIVGGIILLIGFLLLYLAIRQYNTREFSGLAQLEGDIAAGQQLVKSGLNQYVRHPLYFASLLLFWGAFIAWPSASHLLLATLGSLYIIVGSQLEERKLVRLFGDDYKQYQQEVPMLIPRISSS